MIPDLTDLNDVDVTSAVTAYMANGLPIFPVESGGKKPATRHGFKDAIRYYLADEEKQKQFEKHVPAIFSQRCYNIGIATGDVVDVLDVDVKNGKPGLNALRTLRDARLLTRAVATARTPSGGWHLYFPAAGQPSKSLPDLGLDLKAEGGYVLASPSSVMAVEAGKVVVPRYEWTDSRWIDAGDPLEWAEITSALGVKQMERTRTWTAEELGVPLAVIVDGLADWVGKQSANRNAAVYWAAHRAIEAGARTEADLRPLVDASLRVCLPGDGYEDRETELLKTIRSALKNTGNLA